MKTEIKTGDWSNGQRKYEIPYVNGQRHGLSKGWHENGNKDSEVPFINRQIHGLVKWWHDDGSLFSLRKWHHDQMVWAIKFPSKEQTPGDAEVELFFHPTLELI